MATLEWAVNFPVQQSKCRKKETFRGLLHKTNIYILAKRKQRGLTRWGSWKWLKTELRNTPIFALKLYVHKKRVL